VGGVYTVDGPKAVELIGQLAPRIVVPIHYKTDVLNIGLHPIEPFLESLGDGYEIVRPVGNTLAVRQAEQGSREVPRVVLLSYVPWEMPSNLQSLFDKKEAACQASQRVFAALREAQLNFRPANGTHTPRWNAEHMLGRELGFFSQIYAALDPEIGHLDINPQQMPPDYRAAHPTWSGKEEARQMERVSQFTRRFAYLLENVNLDEPAPNSRWTLSGLLEQMERHYQQHTANVVKKFELPDWPGE